MTQPASVGSQLLYTYQAGDHCKKQVVGQSRPAVVVREWGSDLYNVQVFTDGRNDFDDGRLVLHVTSAKLCECIGKGHLCWPGSTHEAAPHPEPLTPEEALPQLSEEAREAVSGMGGVETNAVLSLGSDGLQVESLPEQAPAKRKPGRPKKGASK